MPLTPPLRAFIDSKASPVHKLNWKMPWLSTEETPVGYLLRSLHDRP